ncbi:c-type cytochrome [Geoalkalibacter halelectricus]|uniref:Cytochrome c domain-containing protein n=1 Tax=Geoalkalibacter halelectricus TaxID=2847045 RepID=A0ABY5ZUH9_9BACT|nr:hypothetical protein [Geoalkalibacter halelectricus]MDO3376745.1 hypothetical protein [Geoalkalibacter halelectricus]UWZ81304.1 hypothetical protein L9S41_07915 [Geoalkalibacter halelectricus]
MGRKIAWGLLAFLVLSGLVFYVFAYQWPPVRDPALTMPDGDPAQGRQAIVKYGCSSCHVIPNVRQATGRVGPKLEDIGRQIYLAGVLPNTPDNMIRWIMHPREIAPLTAMPELDVSEQEARDIGAHLYGQGSVRQSRPGHGGSGGGHSPR